MYMYFEVGGFILAISTRGLLYWNQCISYLVAHRDAVIPLMSLNSNSNNLITNI